MNRLKGLCIVTMIVGLLLMGDLATARDDDSFSADDARNFTRQIFQADFSTIEVSGNNITFYGPDGELQCRSEYRFAGKMNGPGFDEGEGSEWYKFESISDDVCPEYKYVVATEIAYPEGMTYWNMRYGNTSFEDLINDSKYAMWYPTMTVSDFTSEELAKIVLGDEEEAISMGAAMAADRESQVSLEDWSGKWVNTGTMVDDSALIPFYQAMADAANASAANATASNASVAGAASA
jgi:Zn/Cd-binding protein ZinT